MVGKLAKVSGSNDAFRMRLGPEGKGTIRDSGKWKAILSTPEGRELERLLVRPEEHFAKVTKYARMAKYLPPEPGSGPAQVALPEEEAEGESEEDDATRARKQRKSKKKGKSKDEAPESNRIRIVAPAQEAIQSFTTIVNSGCLGGG